MNSRSPEAKRAGAPTEGPGRQPKEGASARWTLIRVIVAQLVALGLLWLLQARYHI